jgi:hypothetical protein
MSIARLGSAGSTHRRGLLGVDHPLQAGRSEIVFQCVGRVDTPEELAVVRGYALCGHSRYVGARVLHDNLRSSRMEFVVVRYATVQLGRLTPVPTDS